MKLIAFSIFDEKATLYSSPFFTTAIGLATRMFSDLANNTETNIGKHPEDYKLYKIGTFTDNDAKLKSDDTIALIASATDFLERETLHEAQRA